VLEPNAPLIERSWETAERMVDVDEALARVLAAVSPLPAVDLPLLDADGLVLAADIVATSNVPPFRNSAMDGYAVRAADTAGASPSAPIRLRIGGSVAAGQRPDHPLHPGTAIRVMTGAAVPDGADAVVRFEETDEIAFGPESNRCLRSTIGIARAATPGENVRPAGEDVAAGSTILAEGTLLRPFEIGLMAALNYQTAPVHRRPLVALISTGDEVVDPGQDLLPGQIRNSNSLMLAAMAKRYGAEPIVFGVARDNSASVSNVLARAGSADLIVTSGGVSIGDYDVVKKVLRAEGNIALWQVRMKPGKPLAFGSIGGRPLLGLPGNPVAAAVSFEQFGRPAIKTMLGRPDRFAPTVEARLRERIENRGQRRHYVRVRVERSSSGEFTVSSAGDQGAGMLTTLARANGLLVIPETLDVAEPGMRLTVQMIDWAMPSLPADQA
jgi:molybdopterin molybdotransferase